MFCNRCGNETGSETKRCQPCKTYMAEAQAKYRAKQRQKGLCRNCRTPTDTVRCPACTEAHRIRMIKNRVKLRMKVIEGYGGECCCCGEIEPCFLQLDHVNNDGHIERRQTTNAERVYRTAIKEGFPDRYQLLCANCNFGKFMNNGVCPHKDL